MLPTKTITINMVGVNSKKGDILIIRKTPAVTIVAAWIKADTGVGPSIASGNHVCRPIWADFPITPTNNNNEIKSKFQLLLVIKKEYENITNMW